MFDYEEYFNDPSEADAIIQEAREKLRELLTDSVKQIMEEAKAASDELKKIQTELFGAKCKLEQIRVQIEAENKKAEQTDKYDMPQKYIKRFVQDATGGFAPGDTVWVISSVYTQIPCEVCNGQKKVKAHICGKEHYITCPQCNGRGFETPSKFEVKEEKVSEVRLKLCFRDEYRRGVNYWNTDCVYLGRSEYSSNPKDIFRTKEEAIEALKLKGGAGNG